ncbi:putative membrane-bound acyltransferase YkrP [Kroppenstedtia guangzhouensis]|uniref:Membrane-bound acyltransferase YkrP n=1 Tax=Kroppenstedtia guangzhouensis TaxID=1274356 RepID=A0ABQ1GHM4_9BACL|nr:acyltransferase family protein [Kroppenstedtia guangzhouensis]GGA43916.1 putative membrane-bound acyltransferase YkrP [Kroppenstedtia guangzhouensis]
MSVSNLDVIKSSTPKQRDYYFDNIKFVLIILVVIGHTYRPLIDESSILKAIYLAIYSFHMPLFILVSGYFAKGYNREGQNRKLISSILVPYLIFQILYSIYDHLVYGTDSLEISILDPYWIMWFLFSLFLWRLMMLPLFVNLKYPLVTALILSIAVGYIDEADGFLSLSRTIAFFPFFLLGFYLRRDHFKVLFSPWKRVIGWAGCILLVPLMYWLEFLSPFDLSFRRWLYFTDPYESLGHPEWSAGLIRVGFIILTLVVSAWVLAVIPREKTWFSAMGSRSLTVYLLHGFFIKFYDALDVDDKYPGPPLFILATLGAIALTFLLSSPWVTRGLRPLLQPRLKWIFRTPSKQEQQKLNKAAF